MKTFALVVGGIVQEVIRPATYPAPDPSIEKLSGKPVYDMLKSKEGSEIPIDERYTPEFVALLVDITDLSPMPDQLWKYDGESFTAP